MRVLVVDDHSLFRDGLISLLTAAEIDVAGEASDGVTAVREALRLKPDVVLMDLNMPNMNGLEAMRQIHASSPETKVVMLTVSDDSNDLVQAIENGASGYLLKNLDARNFISSLRGVERGEAAMTGELTFRLMRHIAQKAKEPQRIDNFPSASLSEREIELLRSLAQGMSNKEIAQLLSISENTVKYHCKNILQKLNLKNRTEAAAYAVQHGLTIVPEAD